MAEAEAVVENEEEDIPSLSGVFTEPEGYYPPSPKPTTETYTLLNNRTLSLSLVGFDPLYGHRLWNGARSVARYIEERPHLVAGKTVLELGAGAGLPGLVSGILGAKKVVITDFPDPDLVATIWKNIEACGFDDEKRVIGAGYCWGADRKPIQTFLEGEHGTFDLLILADLLFNHSEHAKLITSIETFLSNDVGAQALVFFVSYVTHKREKDMRFFELAADAGFTVEKVAEEIYEKPMFEDDPGDDLTKRTMLGYVVRW